MGPLCRDFKANIDQNTHECKHLLPLLEDIAEGTTVYADKGYDSKENRQHLKEHRLLDGIMRKAQRNRPLTEAQTKRNRYLSKTRYVVEQSFGMLHRKFRYARAAYFGLCKVSAQSHLKAMCLNLLKAANRLIFIISLLNFLLPIVTIKWFAYPFPKTGSLQRRIFF